MSAGLYLHNRQGVSGGLFGDPASEKFIYPAERPTWPLRGLIEFRISSRSRDRDYTAQNVVLFIDSSRKDGRLYTPAALFVRGRGCDQEFFKQYDRSLTTRLQGLIKLDWASLSREPVASDLDMTLKAEFEPYLSKRNKQTIEVTWSGRARAKCCPRCPERGREVMGITSSPKPGP